MEGRPQTSMTPKQLLAYLSPETQDDVDVKAVGSLRVNFSRGMEPDAKGSL